MGRAARAALVAGSVVLLAGCTGRSHQATPTPTPSVSSPSSSPSPTTSAVVAQQVIGFHGIEVSVPAAWKINNTKCGEPMTDTVVRDLGGSTTCALTRRPRVSFVELFDNPSTWRKVLRPVRVSVNSHGVRLEENTIKGRPGTAVLIPTVGVLMVVNTVQPDDTLPILDSVEIVGIDATGCQMRQDVLSPPPGYEPFDQADLKRNVIPSGATDASVCHYENNWLVSGTVVTGTQLSNLVEQANTAPPGSAYAPTSSYAPSICTQPASRGGEAGSGFVVLVHYSDRPDVVLWAHIGFCGPLGVTNGIRSAALTARLADAIAAPLHAGYALPGSLAPGSG